MPLRKAENDFVNENTDITFATKTKANFTSDIRKTT